MLKIGFFSIFVVSIPKFYEAKGEGLEEPQGGTPPFMKKISIFKIDF